LHFSPTLAARAATGASTRMDATIAKVARVAAAAGRKRI